MAKYRKKPVVIDAVQWIPNKLFCEFRKNGEYVNHRIGHDKFGVEHTVCDVGIRTLEGFMHIKPGDWIITGVQGERYPCNPEIFAATYDVGELSAMSTPRQTCSPENPMPKGALGRWEHTNVVEDGDGCMDGCCADYRCTDCGHKWREELPQ